MSEQAHAARTLPYLPALDGLRGLLLVPVLAYHANPSWFPGAMIAMTAFFTLSGFLITSLLVRELESSGRVDLRAFWIRRARRLVPASVAAVALVAVLVVAGMGVAGSGHGLVGDAASALTWTANWRFVADGSSYASLFDDPSPFQHFWSLAVEEQVYLILPVAALVLLGRHGRRRGRFAAFLVAGIAVSTYLAATLHATGESGGHAYYGTDARIAEPFVGALLALCLARRGSLVRLGRDAARAAGWAAGAAFVGLCVMATTLSIADPRLYRGGFLLGAVLTAVVLVGLTQRTTLARVLSVRPLVRLGAISYGVYLFHWPVFQWVGGRLRGSDRATVIAVEVGITLALAAVSHSLLETPIRRRRTAPVRIFTAGWTNASVAALAAIALVSAVPVSNAAANRVDLGIGVDDPVPPPPTIAAAPSAEVAAATGAGAAGETARGDGAAPLAEPTAEPVTPEEAAILTGGDDWSEGRSSEPPAADDDRLRVAVVGDSLAHNMATGLEAWAEERDDVVVYDLSVSFCPLSRGGQRRWDDEAFDVNPRCSWWDDSASERSRNLAAFAPDVIVVEAGFSEMLDRRLYEWTPWMRPGEQEYHQWLLDEYDAMFQAMQSIAASNPQYLSLNAPCGDFSRPRGWRRVSGADERVDELDRSVYPFMSRGSRGDLFEQLCPDGQYSDELWGIPDARPDGMHLTDEAATELARRWLGPLVLQVGGVARPTTVLDDPVPGV